MMIGDRKNKNKDAGSDINCRNQGMIKSNTCMKLARYPMNSDLKSQDNAETFK
jgi:hypothetical protein